MTQIASALEEPATMAFSIFADKSKPPHDADLATAPKDTFLFWNELIRLMAYDLK